MFQEGHEAKPFHILIGLAPGCGGDKLRVLYAICQIVSYTQRDLTLRIAHRLPQLAV